MQLRRLEPEEPERDSDEPVAVESAGDEVARVGECSQQARRRLRLAVVVVPDPRDQARSLVELGERLEGADDRPCPFGGPACRCGGLLAQVPCRRCEVELRTRHRQIVPRVARLGMVPNHNLCGESLASTPNGMEPERRESTAMPGTQKLLRDLRARTPEMVEALRALVEAESPTDDPAACLACVDVVDAIAGDLLGTRGERIELGGRVHLRWRFGATRVCCSSGTSTPSGPSGLSRAGRSSCGTGTRPARVSST